MASEEEEHHNERPLKVARTSRERPRSIDNLPRIKRARLEMLQEPLRQLDAVDDETIVDWLSLFRITANWHGGQFTSRSLNSTPEKREKYDGKTQAQSSSSETHSPITPRPRVAYSQRPPKTLVDSSSRFIFTSIASKQGGENESYGETVDSPSVLVFSVDDSVAQSRSAGPQRQEALACFRSPSLACRPSSSKSKEPNDITITSIAVDRATSSDSSVRFVVTFSTGQASLVRFHPHAREEHFVEEAFFDVANTNLGEPQRGQVVSTALHWPLLITCTTSFQVRIWSLREEGYGQQVQVSQCEQMSTYSCHWPASFRLEPVTASSTSTGLNKGFQGNEGAFRLSIAFSTPVYPSGWSVGFQEVLIKPLTKAGFYSCSSRSAMAKRPHIVTRIDSPTKLKGPRLPGKGTTIPRGRLDRIGAEEVGRPMGLSFEAPFVVVGSSDNGISVFRVLDSMEAGESGLLTVEHLTSLQGHTGTVHSVSLNEGRCVTGGSDGSVRVWKLGDEEAALADATGVQIDASWKPGMGNLVTLQSPSFASSSSSSAAAAAAASTYPASKLQSHTQQRAKTLADILCEIRSASADEGGSPRSAIIRWVASAFDRIVSVTSAHIAPSSSSSCRGESLESEEEQVQVWSFSR